MMIISRVSIFQRIPLRGKSSQCARFSIGVSVIITLSIDIIGNNFFCIELHELDEFSSGNS